MLKIGAYNTPTALWQGHFTRSELVRIGVDSQLVFLDPACHELLPENPEASKNQVFGNETMADALLSGAIDVAVHALKALPTRQPEGIVITALSQREDPADWLLIRSEVVAPHSLLRLPSGAIVGTSAPVQNAQLLDFRPDLTVRLLSGDFPDRLEHLRSGRCDALLVAAADVKWGQLDTSGLEVLAFDPGELVPAPGQGVLAWQCLRDDMATRLLLQKIHHSAVATATNVERQALRLLECHSLNSAGIHCRRDVQGHYHVSAACQKGDTLQRTRLSSCTHMGLAEAVAAALEI